MLFVVVFVALLILLKCNASPPATPRVSPKFTVAVSQIEMRYMEFLWEEMLSDDEMQFYAVDLSAVLFHSENVAKFQWIDGHSAEFAIMKKEHDNLSANILVNNKIGMNNLCKMWQLEKQLDKMLYGTVTSASSVGHKTMTSEFTRLINACENDVNWTEKMSWPDGFERDLSRKHLHFFDEILHCPTSHSLCKWFSQEKLSCEGELAHRLRTAKALGTMDELKMVKRRMARHFLLPDDLDSLERKYPLLMSFDIIDEDKLTSIFKKMFELQPNSNDFSSNSFHLKNSFYIAKIYAFFWENKPNEQLEKLWELFGAILSKMAQTSPAGDRQNSSVKQAISISTTKSLDNLLKYLQNEFGQIGKIAKSYTKFVATTAFNTFLHLCADESGTFLRKVREMSANCIILKDILQFAFEDTDTEIADQFWHLLNVEEDGNFCQQFLVNQEMKEENSVEQKPFESLNVAKLYIECPKENMTNEELIKADNAQIDKDPYAFFLAITYITLLKHFDEKEPNAALTDQVGMEAALWYYRESIRELFEFADSLEGDQSEEFKQLIKMFRISGEEVMLMNIENESNEEGGNELLCKLYQFAHKMTKSDGLSRQNDAWRQRIAQLTDAANSDHMLFEENLIILPNDSKEIGETIKWDEISCKNEKMSAKLSGQLLQLPKIRRIHFFCLDRLIKRFKRMQSFFCYGDGISPVLVKENLLNFISDWPLDVLESKNPEILHLDKLNGQMFVSLFFSQMSKKSGTKEAENYEARIYLSFVITRIKALEKMLQNDDKCELCTILRKDLSKKIVAAKNDFYALIGNGFRDNLRQMHCILFKLASFVYDCVSVGAQNSAIAKWESTECQNEEVIKKMLLEQRKKKKLIVFQCLKQGLKIVGNQQTIKPGFLTRAQIFFDDKKLLNELKNELGISETEVFEEDKMLQLHYIEALFYRNPMENIAGCMKADATVFIRWMNNKEFGKDCANEMMANRIGFVWKNSISKLFAQSYDQMFDMDMPKIEGEQRAEIKKYRKYYANVKYYVERSVKSKRMKTWKAIQKEWTEFLDKSLTNWLVTEIVKTYDANLTKTDTDKAMLKQFDAWIQNLHFETLKGMIADNWQFMNKLRAGCETPEGFMNLVAFLEDKEKALSILRLLGLRLCDSSSRSSSIPMNNECPTAEAGSQMSSSSRNSSMSSDCCWSPSKSVDDSKSQMGSPTTASSPLGPKRSPNSEGAKIPKKKKGKKGKGGAQKRDKKCSNKCSAFFEMEEETDEKSWSSDNTPRKIANEEEEEETDSDAERREAKEGKKQKGEQREKEKPNEEEEEETDSDAERREAKEEKEHKGEQGEKEKPNEKEEEAKGEKKHKGEQGEKEKPNEEEEQENGPQQQEEKEEKKNKERNEGKEKDEKKKEEERQNKESAKNEEQERDKEEENKEEKVKKEKDEEKGDKKGVEKKKAKEEKKERENEEKKEEKKSEKEEEECSSDDEEQFGATEKNNMSRIYNFYTDKDDGKTVGDLADKNVLLTHYADLFWHLMDKNCTATNRKLEIPQLLPMSKNDEASRKETKNSATLNEIIRLLDIGIFSNEIRQRLKAIRHMKGIWLAIGIKKEELAKIEQKWIRLKQIPTKSQSTAQLEQQSYELLNQLLRIMDKFRFLSNSVDEINRVKNELHLRNLALLIANDGNLSSKMISTIMHKARKDPTLAQLSFIRLNSLKCPSDDFVYMIKKANLQREIDVYLYQKWKNNLHFSKFILPEFSANFLSVQLSHISELWQPLNFGKGQSEQTDIDNNLINIEVLEANKYLIFDAKQRQKIEQLMAQLKEIVKKWSSDVNLQFSAEYLLRPIEEIKLLEAVCIMPNEFNVLSSFLGDFYCNSGKKEMCQDNSLYCKLCNSPDISSLIKIESDQYNSVVNQLRFSFKNVQITILTIVLLPGGARSVLPVAGNEQPPSFNGQHIDRILQEFGEEIEKLIRADHIYDEGQFRSSQSINQQTMELLTKELNSAEPNKAAKITPQLSMFERFNEMLLNNKQIALRQRGLVKDLVAMQKAFANFGIVFKILEMISSKREEQMEENGKMKGDNSEDMQLKHKFSITLAYIELWTKSNCINNGQIGYLDFNMLCIMVAKVFLLYPNATVPLLIQQFFVTYSTWKWPLPIQLVKIDLDRKGEFLSWTPGREWITKRLFSPKPLLKLIKPKQHIAVISPTFPEQNLAQNANLSAQKCLHNLMLKALTKIRNETDRHAIIKPLEHSSKFADMYQHFVVVTCTAPYYQIENVTNFVGRRLGHELTDIVEEPLKEWIKFCHVFANPITTASNECKSSFPNSPPNNCKKFWLIGMEMNEPLKEVNQFEEKLKANLRENFDVKIKNDFGSTNSVQIESEYIDGSERLEQKLSS